MEAKAREMIEKRLEMLIGQKMTRGYRWQFMPCFVFEDESGKKTELHAYSRCVISRDNEDVLDSNNIVVPADGVEPREDNDYGILECVFDEQYGEMRHLFPLTVLSAEIKDDGTIRMRLSDGCFFSVIPWPDNQMEAWRIFDPDSDEKHFVFLGNGTVEE